MMLKDLETYTVATAPGIDGYAIDDIELSANPEIAALQKTVHDLRLKVEGDRLTYLKDIIGTAILSFVHRKRKTAFILPGSANLCTVVGIRAGGQTVPFWSKLPSAIVFSLNDLEVFGKEVLNPTVKHLINEIKIVGKYKPSDIEFVEVRVLLAETDEEFNKVLNEVGNSNDGRTETEKA